MPQIRRRAPLQRARRRVPGRVETRRWWHARGVSTPRRSARAG